MLVQYKVNCRASYDKIQTSQVWLARRGKASIGREKLHVFPYMELAIGNAGKQGWSHLMMQAQAEQGASSRELKSAMEC